MEPLTTAVVLLVLSLFGWANYEPMCDADDPRFIEGYHIEEQVKSKKSCSLDLST